MSIRLYKADAGTHVEWFPKKASVDMTFNDLVQIDANGFILRAVDGSTLSCLGLVQKTIGSTDSDYASATRIPVLVPGPDATFLCDVSTGTAAQEDVGQFVDIDDHNSIDVNASTYGMFYIVKFVSATQVIAKLAKKNGPLGA
ncbi:MAG: hypothetical protein NUV80_04640 [Candidatus Berkelbacteria bacterium]|nr:hypothetical protein [Candidatus Berkelbacteria bacterium]